APLADLRKAHLTRKENDSSKKSCAMKHRSLAAITFGLALLAGAGFAQSPTQYDLGGDAAPLPAGDGAYWWKGNLHTHTLWSDADQFPEVSADWYHSHGYHFLQLSDHNT